MTFRSVAVVMIVGFLLLVATPGWAADPGGSLGVEQRFTVGGAARQAVDVRWAGEGTVFLAYRSSGVWEVELDPALTPIREWVPDSETLRRGFHPYLHLATSPDLVASWSGDWQILWRGRRLRQDRTFQVHSKTFGLPVDLDAQADSLAVLGSPGIENGRWKGHDGYLWLGTVSRQLADLHPVLHLADGEPAEDNLLTRCAVFGFGAVRFLSNDRLFVVPGFAPGAVEIDRQGRFLRTWTDDETGLTTAAACAETTTEESRERKQNAASFRTWRQDLVTLDDVLPLATGPGLLLRSVGADGLPVWRLRVLSEGGSVDYAVPVTARTSDDRLHGDVRGDRVLLLRYAGEPGGSRSSVPGELVVATLP